LATDLGSVKDIASLKLQPMAEVALITASTGQARQTHAPASAKALPFPFLTPRAMLRAMQIMRC
jgi:hypothetical protein